MPVCNPKLKQVWRDLRVMLHFSLCGAAHLCRYISFSSIPIYLNIYIYSIHPASRGVATHTAGLFRSLRGAKGGFPPWGLPKLRIFTFPPVGAPQAREHFSPPWGLPKLGNFHFSPPWGLPKLGNFHFSPPSQAREFSLFPAVTAS